MSILIYLQVSSASENDTLENSEGGTRVKEAVHGGLQVEKLIREEEEDTLCEVTFVSRT